MLRFCAAIYTVSRESASLCEKYDVYIGNTGSNNAKKIKKSVSDKFSLKFCAMSCNSLVNCSLVML